MIADIHANGFDAVPSDARCFTLRDGTKEPERGGHGHLDAADAGTFVPLSNYGVVLDGQFILVDFDKMDTPLYAQWLAKMPDTWAQLTPHGEHRLYRVPAAWRGANKKIIEQRPGARRIVGDVKARGYLVGPGSVFSVCPNHPEGCGRARARYEILDAREPVEAPPWLLEFAQAREEIELSVDGHGGVERDRIAIGENDDELTKMAGFMRRRGFSQAAIAQMLWGVIESGVMEQDDARGRYTAADARRIARSAGAWDAGDLEGEWLVAPGGWRSGADARIIGDPIRWWVRGFVPYGQLALLYGPGGIGKSTFLAWLAAVVTQAGSTFGFCGVEEPFETLVLKAVLMGANRDLILEPPDVSKITFPRDVAALETALESMKLGVLAFDSIYTHFATPEGSNAAERARHALGPLAEVAQRTGTTIMGVFHTNKADDYLGSTEMRNVPRCLLEARRTDNGPLTIGVDKSNLFYKPDYLLALEGKEVIACDPDDGAVQLEEQEDGHFEPLRITVATRGADVAKAPAISLDEIEGCAEEVEPREACPLPQKPRRGIPKA